MSNHIELYVVEEDGPFFIWAIDLHLEDGMLVPYMRTLHTVHATREEADAELATLNTNERVRALLQAFPF